MTDTGWHAPPALLERFAHEPGRLDDPTASSIEAHLITCDACRRTVSAAGDPVASAAGWDAIADRIDRPRPVLLERLLPHVGVDVASARILAATPTLQAAGITAIALLAAAAALLSRVAGADGIYLLLAPLVPLAAVALTFAPASDPVGEVAVATPMHGPGLLVRRAALVLAATFVVLGMAALALPHLGAAATAWVLPALALAVGSLALSTWIRVEVAVGVLALAWVSGIWMLWWADGLAGGLAQAATLGPVGQAIALAATVAAGITATVRRQHFTTLETFG